MECFRMETAVSAYCSGFKNRTIGIIQPRSQGFRLYHKLSRLAAPLWTRSNSRTEISRAGSWVLVLNGRGTCANQNDTWPPRLRLSTWPDRILSGQFRFLKGGELNFCDFESADWTNTEKQKNKHRETEIIVVAERGIWKSLFFRALRDTTTKQLGFARYSIRIRFFSCEDL